ncbi:gamma carbonic anhydrase family protein [Nocardioides litoris]|uniref:gamma carbonic anhydrase family protein n=1 Tax=Nocardioides litoris TaxID=1926648 RepID=UPI001FECC926|nr:gamma carbonic anhydrase family protein [Nocardioides litoris]
MCTRRITLGQQTPAIDGRAWIAPSAVLAGAVTIEEGASVWFGAVLRADGDTISIGEQSNIQDGTVIHADPGFPVTVARHVSVGHQAVVHGCSIGEATLVGMGAVILNGAVIGPQCLVAAGAVVLEGAQFEAGTLIAGVPARARRALTEEERADVVENAASYVRLAEQYRAAL